MKLGKREIDALVCPPGRRDRLVFDDDLPGFGMRVTAAGTKTFIFQYQIGGRGGQRARLVLGRYGEITPAQARNLFEIERGKVKEWNRKHPRAKRAAAWAAESEAAIAAEAARQAAEKAAEKEAAAARDRQAAADRFTVATLVALWAEHVLVHRSDRHRVGAPQVIRTAFPTLLDRPAAAVTRGDVQDLLDHLVPRVPVMARRARSYARAAFGWAVARGRITENPFAHAVIEGREISRERALTDAELGEAWRGASKLMSPFGAFLQLLILTLQRRNEVAGMEWGELTPDLSTWTVPATRAKNRKTHIVHLAEPARAVLRALRRVEGVPLVFGVARRRLTLAASGAPPAPRPISGFSTVKERLFANICAERAEAKGMPVEQIAAPDWRMHDLRRTGVTTLARLGVAPHVADRILNHVHGQGSIQGVAAVYQRFEFLAEREAALRVWADHVLAVAEARAMPDNVVSLRRS